MKQKINELSDEKVIALVRVGKSELYREIMNRYQQKLLRYAKYLSLTEDEAKDVVQESFIKVYNNLYRFNIGKKFSSWIYRIVHNETINYIKKRKKEISLDITRQECKNLIAGNDFVFALERDEIKKAVQNCLAKLPIKYREPLILLYLEEKSYEEISDILRMPTGTVGIRISRGKALLKTVYLEKYER